MTLLRLRVVNRLTAVELTPDLFHIGSVWTDMAMQPGGTGGSGVGDFTVYLPLPGSQEYLENLDVYSAILPFAHRIEAYEMSAAFALGGTPRYAGIIRAFHRGQNPDLCELDGSFDPWLLQTSMTFPGEIYGTIAGTSTHTSDQAFRHYLAIESLRWGEDFSAYNAANYTATGTWTLTTDDGVPAITVSGPADGLTKKLQLTAASMATGDSITEITGRLTTTSQDISAAASVGILLYDAVFTTTMLSQVLLSWNSSTLAYDVVLQLSGGGFTGPLTSGVLFSSVALPFDFQLTWVRFGPDSTGASPTATSSNSEWRWFVNGKLVSDFTASTPAIPPNNDVNGGSQIGICFTDPPVTAGTAQAWIHTFTQTYKDYSAFGAGTIEVGTRTVDNQQNTGQASHLDLMTAFATNEGKYWRYTPQALTAAGGQLGSFDYASNPGSDYTDGSITLDASEGGNVISLDVDTADDLFASQIRVASAPASESGGLLIYPNLAAMQTYGVINGSVPLMAVSDFGTLRRNSQAIAASKAAVSTAKTWRVRRGPAIAGKWRSLDQVIINAPLYNINAQPARILGLRFTEGLGEEEVYLDQFSIASPAALVDRRAAAAAAHIDNSFTSRY